MERKPHTCVDEYCCKSFVKPEKPKEPIPRRKSIANPERRETSELKIDGTAPTILDLEIAMNKGKINQPKL